ncbi:hypothetical protein BOTBODRAFT_328302 [Botryobasidium botryosum FD-172 SS1]|uniref:F-box domain-containing protein n=1 Tax=Botryobasidium botryosum (strain FD-172 SS1) TaxID=930990 RepID=A0A067MZA9_BOTB1|nr:hypothetical protein BOTBODRAFT_328302 [Botryobasidium botryosum FD-172 SS1]
MNEIRPVFSVLNKRCNAVVPVSQLPDEILINIFDILRMPDYVGPRETWSYFHATLSVVRALSVCRRWRKIVVETPRLWERVEICDPAYAIAELYVERSRNIPLIVDIRGDWDADNIVGAFIPSAPRWRELMLDCSTSARADHLISRFNAECDRSPLAPLLRALTL